MTGKARLKKSAHTLICAGWALLLVFSSAGHAAKRPLTFQDIMKFKEIHHTRISDNGKTVVYNARPDRGDGFVVACGTDGGRSHKIERGDNPEVSPDGRWVAAHVNPPALEMEKAPKKDKPKPGLALLDTDSGTVVEVVGVKDFALSADSNWLIYRLLPADEKKEKKDQSEGKDEETPAKTGPPAKTKKKKKNQWEKAAATLVLYHLPSGKQFKIDRVIRAVLDPAARYLAYSTYHSGSSPKNGLFTRSLETVDAKERVVRQAPGGIFNCLTWSKKGSKLAFLHHLEKGDQKDGKDPKGNDTAQGVWFWDGRSGKTVSLVTAAQITADWVIPAENKFTWSRDEKRLFFGLKPLDEYRFYREEGKDKKKEELQEKDLYDPAYLLKKTEVDVWHWTDPRIKPNEKKMWDREKKRTYAAVYHLKGGDFLQLANKLVPDVRPVNNPRFALGYNQAPYMREITWDGRYRDVYIIDLVKGRQHKLLTRYPHRANLSPGGRFVAYYLDRHWYLYDTRARHTLRLTQDLDNRFDDEDHDYPGDVPSYGVAGWLQDDGAVLIYDKYDIWRFDTTSGKGRRLTDGRGLPDKITYRIVVTDKEQDFFKNRQPLLLRGFSHEKKYTRFYTCRPGRPGATAQLTGGDKKYTFLQKAKKADRLVYTRQSFREFPDLWVADKTFKTPQKLSAVNPQIDDFLWGTPRLIEWQNLDGVRLQGIVIVPDDYDPDKRYPVVVYYYRFFTQRLYDFNQMVVNHRPNFPYYVSNGYVMFLPDVRFKVGTPGYSATKCVVTGVQKLIADKIADPKAVGLHGHSWSGYQTAFMITQTDIFAAAVAGAPVSNMTSAYGGIRWGSGLARQFQYEKSQSRIGKSLWEAPHLYVENSPLFYADRINTPLLIEHGDKDEAVPWYQGIELYLALRRLNKNCIFLQYNGEPHHLKKYANKLDYSIKMKQFFDHYLKGEAAADWIKEGAAYRKR